MGAVNNNNDKELKINDDSLHKALVNYVIKKYGIIILILFTSLGNIDFIANLTGVNKSGGTDYSNEMKEMISSINELTSTIKVLEHQYSTFESFMDNHPKTAHRNTVDVSDYRADRAELRNRLNSIELDVREIQRRIAYKSSNNNSKSE